MGNFFHGEVCRAHFSIPFLPPALLKFFLQGPCRGSVSIASDVRFPRPFLEFTFSNPFLESALSKPCKGYLSTASHGHLWFTLFASTLSRSLLESAVWSPCRGIGQHRCANPLLPLWVALLASAFSFPLLGFASRVRFLKPAIRVRFSLPLAPVPSKASVTTASQVDPSTPLSPVLGFGKYRFSHPLLESSASRAGLLGSAPLHRLPKSLRGAGFTASQARFLRLLARVRFLQRYFRFRFPKFLQRICEYRYSSALLEAATRVRFLKSAPRVSFLKCLRGRVSTA